MSFDVAADAYDRFMGRFSRQLSAQLADLAGVRPGQRVLDVGSGPGALTGELVDRVGPANVAAVDPSEPFVEALRSRQPGVTVFKATADSLPFGDGAFDAVLAQLVVHFMKDPIAGLREMARVTKSGGTVAASVWDHAGGAGPLAAFWAAAHDVDPNVRDEGDLPGTREGHLPDLFRGAGLRDVEASTVKAELTFQTFDDWWLPYAEGVGPAGAYVATLDDDQRTKLREACRRRLSEPPITITAIAWAARGRA